MSFIQKESFKHKYAKELLFNWLNEGGFDDFKTPSGGWWGDGVFMEYPIVKVPDQHHFNGTLGFNYNFGDGRYEYYESKTGHKISPTYQQCVDYGDIPIAVADIAIVHKGNIDAIFEIYHKNKVSDNKINKLIQNFGELNFHLYEISASALLRLTEKPKNIMEYCE